MCKQGMKAVSVAFAKAAALGACGIGAAHADGLQGLSASATGYGLPSEFSMLIWMPLLLITVVCVGALLWLILADARRGRALARREQPRRRLPLARSRPVHLHG